MRPRPGPPRPPGAGRVQVGRRGPGPAVVWMAATRMTQGRPVFGHNDHGRPVRPGARPVAADRAGNEYRVLRRLRRRPQCRPGGGLPGRRVQLPADPGPRGGRLRRVDGGRVPGRGGRDHRRQPAELGPGLRAPGPAGRGPGPGLPRAPADRVSGRDHLLRASTYYRTAEYYADGVAGTVARASGTGARPASPRPPASSIRRSSWSRSPSTGDRCPGTWCARPPAPRDGDGPRPTLIGVGGFDSSAEELYFHLGAPGGRAGLERVRLRRSRPARLHAPQPDHDLPARLRGAARRGASTTSAGRARRRRRPAGPGRPELRLLLRRPRCGHRPPGAGPGGQPPGRRHEPLHGGVGRAPTSSAWSRDIRPEDVIGVPEDLMPRQMQWGIAAICHRFGVPSFHAWRDAMAAYRLDGRDRVDPLPVTGPDRRPRGRRAAGPVRRLRGREWPDRSPRCSSGRGRCLGPLPGRQHPAVGPGDLRLAGRG